MESITLSFGEIVDNRLQRMNPGSFDDLPCIGLEQLQSDSFNVLGLDNESAASSQKLAIEKGDVLFSRRRVYQRKVGIAPTNGVISTDCMVLRPKANTMIGPLLPFFIRSDAVMNEAIRHSAGSLSPRVNWSWMKDIKFTIPVFEEQKQYADLLWKTEHLIELYKTRLNIYSELVKSRFIELFGDVKINNKKWESKTISEFGSIRLGKMLDSRKQEGKNQYKYLANHNVQWFHFDFNNISTMGFDPEELDEYALHDGDILICEGGEVGRCAVWHNELKDCYYQKALHRLRCNSSVNPDYIAFLFYMMSSNGVFRVHTTTSTIAHLTGIRLKKIHFLIPPIEIQNQFALFVKQVDKSKFALQNAIEDLKMLQKSISNQIFGLGGDSDE